MTENETKTPQPQSTPAEEATPKAPKEAKEKESKTKSEKAELTALRLRVTELQKENEALARDKAEGDDKYLRLAAEYDNFRRRSAKEKESVYTDAAFDVMRDVLPVVDDLERAAAAEGSDEQIRQGLRMTLDAVNAFLEKQGVRRFGAPGDVFDPNRHNAVMHDEDPEAGEGVISDVFQAGYEKGERILRYAMVKVLN